MARPKFPFQEFPFEPGLVSLLLFSHTFHNFHVSIFCAHPERKGLLETRHLARQVSAELRAGGGKHAEFYQLRHRHETQSAQCFFCFNEYSENFCNLDEYEGCWSFLWPSAVFFFITGFVLHLEEEHMTLRQVVCWITENCGQVYILMLQSLKSKHWKSFSFSFPLCFVDMAADFYQCARSRCLEHHDS